MGYVKCDKMNIAMKTGLKISYVIGQMTVNFVWKWRLKSDIVIFSCDCVCVININVDSGTPMYKTEKKPTFVNRGTSPSLCKVNNNK